MQGTDIDEGNIARSILGTRRIPPFGIAGVEAIDLVQRRFDGKRAAMIDRGGSAKFRAAPEHQNLWPARANSAAAVRPPSPEPIMMAPKLRDMRFSRGYGFANVRPGGIRPRSCRQAFRA